MFLTLIAKGIFDKIIIKFLNKGHTYMSCDQDFGSIEKKKRTTKLHVPHDLAQMIGSAGKINPFDVIAMHGCTD